MAQKIRDEEFQSQQNLNNPTKTSKHKKDDANIKNATRVIKAGTSSEQSAAGPISKHVYSRKRFDDVSELVDYVKNSHVNVKRKILLSSIGIVATLIVALVALVLIFLNFGSVTQIEVDKSTVENYYDVEEKFDYGSIDVIVTHLSGRTSRVKLASSMLSAQDNSKLTQLGKHQITVNYADKQTKVIINVVKMYKVMFVAEGTTFTKTYKVVSGGKIRSEDFPEVPQREGYTGVWDKDYHDLSFIISNTRVNAVYSPNPVGITFPGNIDEKNRRIYDLHTQEETAYVDGTYSFSITLCEAYSRNVDTIVVDYNGEPLTPTREGDVLLFTIGRVSPYGGEVTFENLKPNAYAVSYYDYSGVLIKRIEVDYDDPILTNKPDVAEINVPNSNARFSYEFAVWSTNSTTDLTDVDTDIVLPTDIIVDDIDLYAKYNAVDQFYTITFRDPTDPDRILLQLSKKYDDDIQYSKSSPTLVDSNNIQCVFDYWEVVAGSSRFQLRPFDSTFKLSNYYNDESVPAGELDLCVHYKELLTDKPVECVLRFYLDGMEVGVYAVEKNKTYSELFFGNPKEIELLEGLNTKEYVYSNIVWYQDLDGNKELDIHELVGINRVADNTYQITGHMQFVADFDIADRVYTVKFLQENGDEIDEIELTYGNEIDLSNEEINDDIKANKDISRAFKEWTYNDNSFNWEDITDSDVLDGIFELKASYDVVGTREYTIIYTYKKSDNEFNDDILDPASGYYEYIEEVEYCRYDSILKSNDDVTFRTIAKIYNLENWLYNGLAFNWADVTSADVLDGVLELVADYSYVDRQYHILIRFANSVKDVSRIGETYYGIAEERSAAVVSLGEVAYTPNLDVSAYIPAMPTPDYIAGSYASYTFYKWIDIRGTDLTILNKDTLATFETIGGGEISGILFTAMYTLELNHLVYFELDSDGKIVVPDGCTIVLNSSNIVPDGDSFSFTISTNRDVRVVVINVDTEETIITERIDAGTVDRVFTIDHVDAPLFVRIVALD